MNVKKVALYHWCLRQGKKWENVSDVLEMERHVLVFLIVDEVLTALGLAV